MMFSNKVCITNNCAPFHWVTRRNCEESPGASSHIPPSYPKKNKVFFSKNKVFFLDTVGEKPKLNLCARYPSKLYTKLMTYFYYVQNQSGLFFLLFGPSHGAWIRLCYTRAGIPFDIEEDIYGS